MHEPQKRSAKGHRRNSTPPPTQHVGKQGTQGRQEPQLTADLEGGVQGTGDYAMATKSTTLSRTMLQMGAHTRTHIHTHIMSLSHTSVREALVCILGMIGLPTYSL
jgi:hypothetical protein